MNVFFAFSFELEKEIVKEYHICSSIWRSYSIKSIAAIVANSTEIFKDSFKLFQFHAVSIIHVKLEIRFLIFELSNFSNFEILFTWFVYRCAYMVVGGFLGVWVSDCRSIWLYGWVFIWNMNLCHPATHPRGWEFENSKVRIRNKSKFEDSELDYLKI